VLVLPERPRLRRPRGIAPAPVPRPKGPGRPKSRTVSGRHVAPVRPAPPLFDPSTRQPTATYGTPTDDAVPRLERCPPAVVPDALQGSDLAERAGRARLGPIPGTLETGNVGAVRGPSPTARTSQAVFYLGRFPRSDPPCGSCRAFTPTGSWTARTLSAIT